MSKWYDKPTKILFMERDINYVMCIDANGNSNFTYLLKQMSEKKEISEDEKYFTITGCIFTREEYEKSKEILEDLKNKYWNNGLFYDVKLNKNRAVCFHSRDIRKHNSYFNDKALLSFENKIVGYPDYKNRGMKIFP